MYVAFYEGVIPIRTATNRPGKPIPIPVGNYSPWQTPGQVLIVSTPDSKTVYAASPAADKVTPISTATNRSPSRPARPGSPSPSVPGPSQ